MTIILLNDTNYPNCRHFSVEVQVDIADPDAGLGKGVAVATIRATSRALPTPNGKNIYYCFWAVQYINYPMSLLAVQQDPTYVEFSLSQYANFGTVDISVSDRCEVVHGTSLRKVFFIRRSNNAPASGQVPIEFIFSEGHHDHRFPYVLDL